VEKTVLEQAANEINKNRGPGVFSSQGPFHTYGPADMRTLLAGSGSLSGLAWIARRARAQFGTTPVQTSFKETTVAAFPGSYCQQPDNQCTENSLFGTEVNRKSFREWWAGVRAGLGQSPLSTCFCLFKPAREGYDA